MKSINTIFLVVVTILIAASTSFGQVNSTTLSVNSNTLHCGDAITFTAFGTYDTVYSQLITDFSSSLNGNANFSSYGNALNQVTSPCGSGMWGSNDDYAWFWGNVSERYLITAPLDLTSGVTEISFQFKYGENGQSSGCDGPQLQSQGVYFYYKSPATNNNWQVLYYFNPDTLNSAGGSSSPLINWSTFTFSLPQNAITSATSFKWEQDLSAIALDLNSWGLDSISLDSPVALPELAPNYSSELYKYDSATSQLQLISSFNGSSSYIYNTTVYESATYINMYYETSVDTVYDTVSISTTPMLSSLSLNNTILCNGSSAQVEALDNANSYQWESLPGGDTIHSSNFSCNTCRVVNASPDTTTTYVVHISKDNLCFIDDTITINVPLPIISQDSIENITCYGGNNGLIAIYPSQGIAPYSYQWSNGVSSFLNTQLFKGNYSVTVTDSIGCAKSFSFNITQPSSAISFDSVFIENTPVDTCVGSASIIVSGGISPYTYLWNDSASTTTQTVNNLCTGYYSVTVTDSVGCNVSLVTQINIDSLYTPCLSRPSINSLEITNTLLGYCYGSASITAYGGIPPYSFQWGDSIQSSIPNIDSLCAGIYSVTVTDSIGCSDSIHVIISDSTPVSPCATGPVISEVELINTTEGNCIGAAQINVSGGTAPYIYQWNDSNNTTTNVAVDLCANIYTVTVTDSNNCSAQISINLLDTCAADTLNSIELNTIQSNELTVYPNPFEREIHLTTQVEGYYKVNLYSIGGMLIFSQNQYLSKNSTKTLSLPSELSSGIYILSVINEQENTVVKRLIKQ